MVSREYFKSIKIIRITYYFFKYIIFQLKLIKEKIHDWQDAKNNSSIPIPPAELRHRVHGSLDKESFIRVGKNVEKDIRNLCSIAGCNDVYSLENILDFGCGCGRVLRNFQDAPKSCHFHGTDIDIELINWGKIHLSNIDWSINDYNPPLKYQDNTFDLIYSISVFTHLDEELQYMWLSELRRILKVGGLMILTIHGSNTIGNLSDNIKKTISSHGFAFLTGSTGKLKLDGLPDFYQTAFHTKEYIHREWSKYLDIIDYIECGINNHQDVVILKKR